MAFKSNPRAAVGCAVFGTEGVRAALADLEKKLRKKILNKAVGDGDRVLLRAMKANCPRDSDTLLKSLGQRVKVYRYGEAVAGMVGPRTNMGRTAAVGRGRMGHPSGYAKRLLPTKYAHMQERRMGFASSAMASASAQAAEATRSRIEAEIAGAP